ncbi:MAG: hypothetical protein ABSE51_19945 [Terracidiphilus sp.]|jgi:hypothetical protein
MKNLSRIAITTVIVLSAALGHAQATNSVLLTWQDTSCTTATPCTAQVFRAAAACPASGIGTLTYAEITALDSQSTVAGAYTDTTAVQGQTYCYYVTDSFVLGGTAPSSPSNTFQLTLPVTIPATPTGLSGTIVAGA